MPASERASIIASSLELPVFSTTDAATRDRLFASARVVEVDPGESILNESSASTHLFALMHGTAGVFYTSGEGVSVLVKIFGAPAVFGEMELLAELDRLESVEAFEPCTVVVVPRAEVLDLWQTSAPAAYAMLNDVSRRLCVAAYNERALAFQDVGTRLAGLLSSFFDACGTERDEASGGGERLRIKLTYETLARCLGATTRSIDRTLGQWRKEGWLERDRGFLAVSSRKALEQRAAPERLALFTKLGM